MAKPVSFGFKLAIWYEEACRHRTRLQAAKNIAVGKLSGAMERLRIKALKSKSMSAPRWGWPPDPVSNQIVQRDRHAGYASTGVAGRHH